MTPTVENTASFAVPPTWLTGSCPQWCQSSHEESHTYPDRVHWSAEACVPMSAAPGDTAAPGRSLLDEYDPDEVRVYLTQHYRECGPRIEVGRTDEPVRIALTPAEANQLADALRFMVGLATAAVAGRPAAPAAGDGALVEITVGADGFLDPDVARKAVRSVAGDDRPAYVLVRGHLDRPGGYDVSAAAREIGSALWAARDIHVLASGPGAAAFGAAIRHHAEDERKFRAASE
ncbi:hypothetical protein amrb99_98040 [Actinomadura sp. RB99]|uniref:DUF6907 domain-containing protein n=1 Tax=Actinomadura sp. RB99 TaxID=2691577 RepID=UPI001687560B|nr:hypothetical protein [Actinomadura sp. RB99]MBD2900795.1 hypothetical protein [Actinomadura sp. RB99]